MTAISITAGNVVRVSGSTINKDFKFGATVTQGQVLYKSSSNLWLLATNATLVGSNASGIALNAGASGQPATVLTEGDITIGGTVAVGKHYVLGVDGAIIPVDDATASGTVYSTYIGVGISATVIRVKFNVSGVEYADDVA